jgi:hypothetical protein
MAACMFVSIIKQTITAAVRMVIPEVLRHVWAEISTQCTLVLFHKKVLVGIY